jgi:hypothetical protein
MSIKLTLRGLGKIKVILVRIDGPFALVSPPRPNNPDDSSLNLHFEVGLRCLISAKGLGGLVFWCGLGLSQNNRSYVEKYNKQNELSYH